MSDDIETCTFFPTEQQALKSAFWHVRTVLIDAEILVAYNPFFTSKFIVDEDEVEEYIDTYSNACSRPDTIVRFQSKHVDLFVNDIVYQRKSSAVFEEFRIAALLHSFGNYESFCAPILACRVLESSVICMYKNIGEPVFSVLYNIKHCSLLSYISEKVVQSEDSCMHCIDNVFDYAKQHNFTWDGMYDVNKFCITLNKSGSLLIRVANIERLSVLTDINELEDARESLKNTFKTTIEEFYSFKKCKKCKL
jgi:hypothetical protein